MSNGARTLPGLRPSIYEELSPFPSSSLPLARTMVLLLSYLLSALAWTTLYPAVGVVSGRKIDRNHIQALRQHAADRVSKNTPAVPSVEGGVRLSEGVQNFTFSNPAASGKHLSSDTVFHTCGILNVCVNRGTLAFYVNGTSIPEVDWDIGPSWAGLLPISGNANETRQVGRLSGYPLWALRKTHSCSFGSSHLDLWGAKIH